ncbi:MAG TPA: MltA domain-containing protein, partial [Burkholderiales bacterium]|nr:MltA domain-containing protein [Burkholderiales bacterium]
MSHTIARAIASATPISRYTTHISRLALILLVAGCAEVPQQPCPCPPPKPAPERAQYIEWSVAALPGWDRLSLEPSLRAFMAGCARAAGPLINACATASTVAPGDEAAARQFFESAFTAYALVSSETGDTGVVTGYYEPIVRGSRTPSALNRFPIYGVPDDLLVVDLAAVAPDTRSVRLRGRLEGRRVVPYYSRAEIMARTPALGDSRADALRASVLGWTADPIELFFMQIQGSGQLELENGERVRLAYGDQNGHPYRSVGRYLVERGEMTLDQASMQSIKAWAMANPQKLQDALEANPSYVFFRETADPRGPVGALGVPLVPEFSIAVDRRFIPLGAPVFLVTTYPLSDQPLVRVVAAHDTGGAIRGAVRADFFWGTGEQAGITAGRMRQPGRMWLLWP